MKTFQWIFRGFNLFFHRIISATRHISIYKRLVVSFLTLIIVPNLIISYISFDTSSKEIENNILNYSYRTVDNMSSIFDEKLKKYEDLSYEIYINDKIKELLKKCYVLEKVAGHNTDTQKEHAEYKKEINALLYDIMIGKDNNITVIQIVNSTDEFTQINSHGMVKGGCLRDTSAFAKSNAYKDAIRQKGYPVWVDTSKDNIYRTQTKPYFGIDSSVTFLRSIPDDDTGEPIGVIVIGIATKAFLDTEKIQDDLVSYGNILLLSDKGVISSLNENVNGPILDKELSDEILKMDLRYGSLVRKVNGEECFAVFQQSKYTKWTVVNLIPRKKLLSSVYEVRNMIFKISGICIIAALILAYVVTLGISSPLNRLKKTMEMVDEKSIDVSYKDEVSDEIGILGQKFNGMILRIKSLISTVYEMEITKKNEEIRRKQAELDALQMQINPHFIYNTLDFIRWQAIFQEGGDGKVSQMVAAFSSFLRLGTKKCGKLVTIKEELDHVNAYLKVLEFNQKAKVDMEIDIESDKIHKAMITKLTLQPLVENAMAHGFLKKSTDKKIVFRVYMAVDDVVISIKDNGSGMDEETVKKISNQLNSPEHTGSIGLRNVNERIKLNFGEGYGLKIYSEIGEGSTVVIRIPYIIDSKGEDEINV